MLDLLKTYLRIDGSEDDQILTLLISSAKSYLSNAGVPESESDLYKLAVMLHATMHYENRDPATQSDKLSFSLQSIILQLKDYGTTTA